MNVKQLNFKHVYTIFPCIFKRNLPGFIFDIENSVRENATDYECPSVELVTFQKVGFYKYLVIWKVQGFLRRTNP